MECCKRLPRVPEPKCRMVPVNFLTVEEEGTLETNPPVVGKRHNMLAVYQDSNARVVYDSAGVPSILVDDVGSSGVDDFDLLTNRPKYAGEEMTGATDIPKVPDEITIKEYNGLWE